jgi:hypothetical protein
LRAARIGEIERDLREPALAHLRSGSGSATEVTGYAEALIKFYGGNLNEALAATRQAFEDERWLYEAKRLEGDILLEMGAESALHGDADGALSLLAEAGVAYALAAEIARSDPSVHEGECGRWTQVLEIRSRRGAPVVEAFDGGRASTNACRTSTGDGPTWSTIVAEIPSRSSINPSPPPIARSSSTRKASRRFSPEAAPSRSPLFASSGRAVILDPLSRRR